MELPSDSDSSDEDFVPKGAQESDDGSVSCEEEAEGEEELDEGNKRKKRTKRGGKKTRKKQRKRDVDDSEEDPDNETNLKQSKIVPVEEVQSKAESLWADFMKDVGDTLKPKQSGDDESQTAANRKEEATSKAPEKVAKSQVYTFAGEEVEVAKETPTASPARFSSVAAPKRGAATGGALSKVLGQIGGSKNKLSVLEKSKLDWQQFKAKEGIEDELQIHNRGRGGYLERKDFLERADLRQFEIEKSLREVNRGKR